MAKAQDIAGGRIRVLVYIEPGLVADLRRVTAELRARAIEQGQAPSSAPSMSDVVEDGLRAILPKYHKRVTG